MQLTARKEREGEIDRRREGERERNRREYRNGVAEPSHTVACLHTHCVSPLTSVEEHEANDRLFHVHLELVPTEDDALDDDPVWVHRQE